ncbi:MAG: exosortase-associated EpsI family protein [Planctomycetaceae bacterium]|nr:exosortase-associated EpsI family protein [Planctomycetaceae bacterium]
MHNSNISADPATSANAATAVSAAAVSVTAASAADLPSIDARVANASVTNTSASASSADLPDAQSAAVRSVMSRRDVVIVLAGIAVMCFGQLADSHINPFSSTDPAVMLTAVEHLRRVPDQIGTWSSVDGKLTEEEIQAAGIEGYLRREYRDQTTGYRVNMTLLCGLAGPMSVHPPTACFEGVGYTLCAGPLVVTTSDASVVGGPAAEFNKSAFRQGDTSFPELVRVFWAWGSDGHWQAPQNPRLEFRGQPYLYKLYVTDRSMDAPGSTPLPQAETFLEAVLPALSEALGHSAE